MRRICKRITYTGRVQGVGFRYQAAEAASQLDVNGYVKNLEDGGVELVAEGPTDQVEALMERIAERMSEKISKTIVTEQSLQGFTNFQIRYY